MITLEYDCDAIDLPSYGCWRCPECAVEMFSGGSFRHEKTCSHVEYDGLVFFFGPRALEQDGDALLPFSVTRQDLREVAKLSRGDQP